MRTFTGPLKIFIRILAALPILYVCLELLHIYSYFDIVFYKIAFRALFTGLILALVFLCVPPTKKAAKDKLPWYDALLAIIIFCGGLYPFLFYERVALRASYATPFEIILGIIVILLVMESARRTSGVALVFILVVFVLYAPYCNYFPGLFRGMGYSIPRTIGHMYLFEDGVFGLVIGVISTLVVAYVLFSQLLFACGIGDWLTKLAVSLLGGYAGGPAKVSVVSSGLFGMISGSAVGNVLVDGAVTIPLMVRTGYKPHYAAAVEAVASTGGALMPPVMGAVAFIMADFLQVSYGTICVAAAWPAILYYVALYVQVDEQARKLGLRGLPREERPPLKETLREGWAFGIPLVVLIYLLMITQTLPERAAFYAMGTAIIVGLFKKEMRIGPKRMFGALESTGMTMIRLVPVCAGAGLIIASVGLTGLGVNLSSILITVAKGSVLVLLVLTAFVCVIMSMGLPWTGCYILLAILVAPALSNMGIEIVSAHLFIFYMGLISFLTPPVCLSVYAACGISNTGIWPTGYQAVRLAIVAYFVPFIFVWQPALIMRAPLPDILLAIPTSLIGVVALASGLEGYIKRKATWFERLLWAAGGICLVIPGLKFDIIGVIVVAVGTILHFWTPRQGPRSDILLSKGNI